MTRQLNKILLLTLCAFVFVTLAVWKNTTTAENNVSENTTENLIPHFTFAEAFAVSEPLSALRASKETTPDTTRDGRDKIRQMKQGKTVRKYDSQAVRDADGAFAEVAAEPMPSPLGAFEGLANSDVEEAYGILVAPPDATGDVGRNFYVQAVNILFRVYDKDGAPQTAPLKYSQLFAPLGTVCANRNDGDPLVLYDNLADRWIISVFCTNAPPFRQMIAVSQTNNPSGAYYLYEFVMPNFKLNDYSKIGAWTNSYLMTTDQFVGDEFRGTGVFAFDKWQMLRGNPNAGYVYFDLASPTTIRLGGMLPADIEGVLSPKTTTNPLFMSYSANEYGDAADALRIFELRPDFARPQLSTFGEIAGSPLPTAAFDPTSEPDRFDVPQPNADKLDAQSDRLMYRLTFRRTAAGESLIVNQTVRISAQNEPYRAGVRVYELRRPDASSPFAINNQVTYGDETASRWMGSAAGDGRGNIAFGYSLSNNETIKPSIGYAGRAFNDAPNLVRKEQILTNGTGVQELFGGRWGDYTTLSVDPTDDCTFFYTNQYYTLQGQQTSPLNWQTRVGKFRFDNCQNALPRKIFGTIRNASSGQPVANAQVSDGQGNVFITSADGTYQFYVPNEGNYNLSVSASSYQRTGATISVGQSDVSKDFLLETDFLLAAQPFEFVAESCTRNNALDVGETVTLNVTFRNDGLRTANEVKIQLISENLINISPAQVYGTIPVGGSATRSFTFTVAPSVACGESVFLAFQITEGNVTNIGRSLIQLIPIGELRTALREDFQTVAPNELPNGWTTSFEGEQQIWRIIGDEENAANRTAYSPEPTTPGVNELVSPSFRINSNQAFVTFRNKYDLESTFLRNKLFDGAVLEIKIGTDAWQDILTAGGRFEKGGYVGTIESCCENPLSGRLAWSSKSGINPEATFAETKALLPPSARGRDVRLRWRVGTDIGSARRGQWIDDVNVTDGYVCACAVTAPNRAPYDFDGDGRTDFAVFRPSNGFWFVWRSSNATLLAQQFGATEDRIASADFDGDGKTDFAVFRPSNGVWYILQSSDNRVVTKQFGLSGDRPVPQDYDGDGKVEIAVYRRSNGVWYGLRSGDGSLFGFNFGIAEDLPVRGDFDGDRRADYAVFRPSSGTWYVQNSASGFRAFQFGANGDVPLSGDYDGDGKTDFAVFRASNGTFYLQMTTQGFTAIQFGTNGDVPLQGDFDGDGKSDVGVFRPSNNVWYVRRSGDGQATVFIFGSSGDLVAPSGF